MPKFDRWSLGLFCIALLLGLAFIPVQFRVREARTAELVKQVKFSTYDARTIKLLRLGADPNAVDAKGEPIIRVASRARNFRMVHALQDAGAVVDPQTRQFIQRIQNQRLLDAIANKDPAALKDALANGAEVNFRSKSGDTPLVAAIRNVDQPSVEFLLKHGADPRQKTKSGLAMIPLALLHNGDLEIIGALKTAGAPTDPVSEFLIAAIKGDAAALGEGLRAGIPVDAVSPNGDKWTALFWAASYSKVEAVRLLLEHGANPTLKDRDGATPVTVAFWPDASPARRKTTDLLQAAVKKWKSRR
jgi:ankyrin repeat protein